MTPELEILDQCLSGPMKLRALRKVCQTNERFAQALGGLLRSGDLQLVAVDGSLVPEWQWRELLSDRHFSTTLDAFHAEITDKGVQKIT